MNEFLSLEILAEGFSKVTPAYKNVDFINVAFSANSEFEIAVDDLKHIFQSYGNWQII